MQHTKASWHNGHKKIGLNSLNIKIMKKTLLHLTFTLFTSYSFAQSDRNLFQPLEYSEPKSMNVGRPNYKPALERIQQEYDRNQAKKDEIQDWVYELKQKETDDEFHTGLDKVQNYLDDLEKEGDFHKYRQDLREIQNYISKLISE